MSKLNFNPNKLRETILNMAKDQKSGHLGCALSLVEIVSVLYSSILNFNPKDPRDPERDILALSKGHGVMALYAAFYELGWITDDHVNTYLKDNTPLFGLAEDHISGIEISGGSLGHGLPVAVGMAYGLKLRKSKRQVYCIVGDGEMNEGSMWEAIQFAGHHKLDNLTMIVDDNKFQAMGETKDVLSLGRLDQRLEAFGFESKVCNGHSLNELQECLSYAKNSERPFALIANTIKGAGIPFMENNNIWHYKKMTAEEEAQAFSALTQNSRN
jgi:transketolase